MFGLSFAALKVFLCCCIVLYGTVAIDTVRFTNPPHCQRSYAPEGGGQPHVKVDEYKYCTILYEGLVATGEVLPPVIFTNYPNIPIDFDKGLEAKVFYIKDLSAPSSDLTLRWLEVENPYLEERSVIGHDRGPEYMAKVVQEELEANGYRDETMPAAGGAFINPCDNSFNAILRSTFWKHSHGTYEDKLRAIIKAYYAASGEAIRHFFHHTGWLGDQPSRRSIHHLLAEGYRPGKKHEESYEKMNRAFLAWKKNLRSAIK